MTSTHPRTVVSVFFVPLFFSVLLFSFSYSVFAAEKDQKAEKWTCPMHPHYIATDFGACPICGMDLVKLDTGDVSSGGTGPVSREALSVAPETLQTMGVRLEKAEVSSFGRIIRSFGLVSENERLQFDLTARTEGWIEELRVRAVGDQVKKGDLLFTLYAPEFAVSQQDYLKAINGGNRKSIQSTKTRLKAFGMQERAINEIERDGTVHPFVPFYADRDGTITHVDLRPGSYVKRGTMLTRVQDFSSVWLMVSVPEKDLVFVKPGTKARVTFPNIPGREVFASVEYVYPTVDKATRTGQVRLVLKNPDGQLRPGAYADVAFEVETAKRLSVPSEAILKSGGGRYVIASLGQGRFEPRNVTVGLTSGRRTEVSGEIASGDDIVVSGQFLIDSESALRESFRKLEKLQLPLSLLKLDNTQMAMVDHFVDAALYLHEALTDGYDIDPKFLDPTIEVKDLLWPAFQHTRLAYVMEDGVKAIGKAKGAQTQSELKAALEDLVVALEPWMREGAPRHYAKKKVALYRATQSGQKWLQLSGDALNPYSSESAAIVPWPEPSEAPGMDQESASQTLKNSSNPAPMTGHHHHH